MKTFSDNQGRVWEITVNVNTIKRVRDLVHVDLTALHQDEAQRVFSDPVLLVNTLYAACKPQAEKFSPIVDDVAFGESLVGDHIEAAAMALMEEVELFFPASRRPILRAVREKAVELGAQLTSKTLAAIQSVNLTSLKSATSSPASSASTPVS
jgi:hypothetical protein